MMNTTPADLARQLKAKRSGSGWIARCPAHEDRRESLSIGEGEGGKLLLNCFAGCTFDQIIRAAGVEPSKPNGDDRRPHTKARKMGRIVETYDYTDARGELVYQVCRTDPKGFFQRRPNGHGGWINGRGDTPSLPYRLPQLLDSHDVVFVVEGEKDVDRLRPLGIAATTNAGGAESEWPDAWGRYFDGRHVVIIPDNDDAGRKHAQDVARKLSGKAASVKVVELFGLPPKGDVSDWIAAGGTADQLIDLANEAPDWEPSGDDDLTFDQVDGQAEPFEVDTITTIMNAPPRITLVKGFAGRGELILFYGPPKHGKTFLASHFAISVGVQANWFGRKHKAPEGFVLYCALEGGSGMRQRLKAILQHDPALGDRITDQNLKIMRKRIDLRQSRDVARLLATIAKHERETGMPCLLVVVDTIARALGSGNDTDPKDMSALISASDTIRQAGSQPTVALIHHAGKDVNRGPRGRSDLPGAIDTCVLVERLENGAGNRATCEYAKDDPDGWAIDFTLQQVEIGTDEDDDPITTCVLREGEAHKFAPPKAKATTSKPYRGERQRIFIRHLLKLAAKHPDGVDRSVLRSHFLCELNAERQRDGQEVLSPKLGASTFRQVLLHLRDREPPLFTEEDQLIRPTEELSK